VIVREVRVPSCVRTHKVAETATLCVIPLTATICVRTALASLKMAALAANIRVRALAATLCVRREELQLRARGVDPGR